MNKNELTVAEFIFQCKLRINNSIEDAAIAESVELFGYNATRMAEGKTLLDASEDLCEIFEKEHGEVDAAFTQRNEEKDKAVVLYKKHVAISRIALKNNTGAIKTLQLQGSMPRTLSGRISRIKSFYNNLMANAEWLQGMAGFNISVEELQSGLQLIKNVEQFAHVIMKEKGDAQNATQQRDAKLDELSEWVNDYESIARLALADQPQLLEKLGIVVKS